MGTQVPEDHRNAAAAVAARAVQRFGPRWVSAKAHCPRKRERSTLTVSVRFWDIVTAWETLTMTGVREMEHREVYHDDVRDRYRAPRW